MSTSSRGRRRFLADLEVAQQQCGRFQAQGFQIESIESDSEEGSFLCKLTEPSGCQSITLNFLVSDASEYPNSHTFFCFAQDDEQHLPAFVSQVTESVSDSGSMTINEVILQVLRSLGQDSIATKGKVPRSPEYSENEDEHDFGEDGEEESEEEGVEAGETQGDVEDEDTNEIEDFYDDFDDDFEDDHGPSLVSQGTKFRIRYLQRDFNESVAAGYRPGMIYIPTCGMVVSMSIPVITLAQVIAPRALMAWDARLLSKNQHLTLLISGMCNTYPILQNDGTLSGNSTELQFRVGLTSHYKPSKEYVTQIYSDVQSGANGNDHQASMGTRASSEPTEQEGTEDNPSHFHFSLSTSLEPLLQDRFLKALQLRLEYKIGWAGAELLAAECVKRQARPEHLVEDMLQMLKEADKKERNLSRIYRLPLDHLVEREEPDHLNLPLLAFSYLLRRLSLCARYCLICCKNLPSDIDILKPYVCSDKLCSYQYYNLNRGPSLEYEICSKPTTVDLLISFAYCAVAERCTSGPFPIGMGLMVPEPGCKERPLVEFDALQPIEMCEVIVSLLDTIPPIMDIKHYLEKESVGITRPKLHDYDPHIPPAAWLLLRWCVASCTADLEELTLEEDRIQNVGRQWRQFRFSVGAPDAEVRFAHALKEAQAEDTNAKKYPSLYAFHGSPAKNWHSIIRQGLRYETVTNARAYGNGVYFAKDSSFSMSSLYAERTLARWPQSRLQVSRCVAVVELVNLPSKFESVSPHFVVQQLDWIICRYLLVRCGSGDEQPQRPLAKVKVPFVNLDPKHPIKLSKKALKIPEPDHKLQTLLTARTTEYVEQDYDEDDMKVFEGDNSNVLSQISNVQPSHASRRLALRQHMMSGYFEPRFQNQGHEHRLELKSTAQNQDQDQDQDQVPDEEKDPWKHDSAWVKECLSYVLSPPTDALPMATMALQKELKAVLRDQDAAKSLKQLGWYMPVEYIGDNLFQWIIELHSFEEDLPIAKDMKRFEVNSLVFEVRFPPDFPRSPPFFRILKPRFLPFIRGGGGHVTGGGSMCMNLLTADGWSPSYSIPAILLQIKLAISDLDPRPARLASNWNRPYSMDEAIVGFKRAARTHGWKIPADLDRLSH